MNDLRYLQLLAGQFPNEESAQSEMIRLRSLLHLPKGTELFISDVHGEDEAFGHILNNASGVIYEKIEKACPDLSEEERQALASLIYYPHEQLALQEARWGGDNYQSTLHSLIIVARLTAAKYSSRYVQQAMPEEFRYILMELLSDRDLENRAQYMAGILDTVIKAGSGAGLIRAVCMLIKRLAVARLHLVGDIYDRGPHADVILESLINYHSVDIQWGNHDVMWLGAAAGSPACVACAVRVCIQYDNLDMLENSYGISLLPLALFASRTYKDTAEVFAPRKLPGELYMPQDPQLYARMNKAISVIQYKLEGQLVRRRPEYGMEDRDMMSRVDWRRGTVEIDGVEHLLKDTEFPTIDPDHPLELTDREYALIGQLVDSFRRSERLQKHARFLYQVGNVYQRFNGNLLFHGCIPVEEDGSLMTFRFDGKEYAGKALLDYCGRMARQGYFAPENSNDRKAGRDFLWFLWCGRHAPSFGRTHIATFERTLLAEKSTWKEPQNAYYRRYSEEGFVEGLLSHFGCDKPWSRIINGHVPVKVAKGEDPRKAGGRLIVIDGGFCRAYQKTTGIAGYTMFFSSHGIRIAAHEPFTSRAEAISGGLDIQSHSLIIEDLPRRLLISDTDEGELIARRADDLEALIAAYRDGDIRQDLTADLSDR
ncbi:MAG: fructose-1,6-bisphosphatase [Clostridiales bacterium]|nr:fructose-1,6-bisphosphatase [Clostridiales bacterium]